MAALFVAIISLFSIAVWFLLEYQEIYHKYATSKAYADAEKKFSDECRFMPSVQEVASCFENAIKSARETQRSEEGLYAQKQVAEWAKWMFYATALIGVVSIGVAVAGVLLVNGTLRLQRLATVEAANATEAAVAANELARKAYVTDQRPWVACRYRVAGLLAWTETGFNLTFRLDVRNTGKTPALYVEMELEARLLHGRFDLREEQIAFADKVRKRGGFFGMTLFPGDKDHEIITISVSNEDIENALRLPDGFKRFVQIAVIGCVNYYSDVHEAIRQTGFIFQLRQIKSGRVTSGFKRDDGDVPAEQLQIWDWHQSPRVD